MDRRSYIMFSNYRPSVRICMYIVIGHGLAEYLWICCNHHARDREEAVLARGLPDSSSQVLLGFREEFGRVCVSYLHTMMKRARQIGLRLSG